MYDYYDYRAVAHFDKKMITFKKNKFVFNNILKAIEKLRTNPYYNSEQLSGKKGKRKHDLRPNYRLIFAICEECRNLNFIRNNGCSNCEENDDNTLVLFDVGPRENFYNKLNM